MRDRGIDAALLHSRLRAGGIDGAVLQHGFQLSEPLELRVEGGPFCQCCIGSQRNLRQHAPMVALSFANQEAADRPA
jgi:hypothetical protein